MTLCWLHLWLAAGTLVAKSLMTAVAGPLTYNTPNNALVSLDVFALQVNTDTMTYMQLRLCCCEILHPAHEVARTVTFKDIPL